MQIVMFNPSGNQWYASGDLIDLVVGENTVNWGPFTGDILLRFMIKVDADDEVTFDSFEVANSQFSTDNSGGGDPAVDYTFVPVSITDAFSIDFDAGSTNTTVDYTGTNNSVNQYAYASNVEAGGQVTFTVNVTSLVGDPVMNILMFNPDNLSEYWNAEVPSTDLVVGENELTYGPFENNVHLKFTIELDSDDEVAFDSFVVAEPSTTSGGSISISDEVTIDYDSGVVGTDLIEYSGTHNGVNQYVYGTHITDGSTVTMSLNATAIQGEPTMSIHMYNPDNINQYWDAGAPSQPITLGENVLPWGPHGRVYIRFMIELDAGESVTFSSFSALDSNDDPNAIPDPDNGIRFRFEEVEGGSAAYYFETEAKAVTSTTEQSYSITIPAYSADSTKTFKAMIMKVIGRDQPIAVSDVTLTLDGVTYGGTGSDGMVFDIAFDGAIHETVGGEQIYTFPPAGATVFDWAGFLHSGVLDNVTLPESGLVFDQDAVLTFMQNYQTQILDCLQM